MKVPHATPLPLGRGREAMTYGRVHLRTDELGLDGAAVSHLAELVRGEWSNGARRPPHPPLRGTFSPQGRRDVAA